MNNRYLLQILVGGKWGDHGGYNRREDAESAAWYRWHARPLARKRRNAPKDENYFRIIDREVQS